MPAIGPAVWVAIASLAVSAVGTYMTIKEQQKAVRLQRQANAVSKAEQDAQVAMQRRAQVRQERVRRAEIIASATDSGVGMSSGMLGATSAVGSLVEGNIANISRNKVSSDTANMFNQQAADAQGQARTYQAIASLGGETASFLFRNSSDVQGDFHKIFG